MRVAFGQIVEFAIGGGWGEEQRSDGMVPVRVIRGADFPAAEARDLASAPLRFEPAKKAAVRRLREGDLVLEVSGGTKDRPTGRSIYASGQLLSSVEDDVIPASFCRLVRVDRSRAVPAFVYYALQDLYDRGGTWEYQNQSTGISNFQFGVFCDRWMLDLPPISEQQAIAEVLGALDDKIAANTALARRADVLVRAEYVGLGSTRVKVGDVARSPRLGVDPSTIDPRDPYIGLEHIGRRDMWLSDGGEAGEVTSTKSRFEPGDVLFGKLRPYFHKVATASARGICSTDILVVRAIDPRAASVLLAAATSDGVIEAVTSASEGTRMPRTSWKDLSAVEIAWPDPEQLEHVAARIDAVRDVALAHIAENRILAATRDALLPQLMSGRLRVREAEAVAAEAGA